VNIAISRMGECWDRSTRLYLGWHEGRNHMLHFKEWF